MDWCAILLILSILTDIIQRTLFMSQNCVCITSVPISFHSIAQTLNGFISKRRFGKIAPIPEHLKKNYHSFNIYATDLRFVTYKLENVLQVMIFFLLT